MPEPATVKPEAIRLENEKLRLVVYGDIGVGKTELALSFPRPLVIDTDGGLISVAYRRAGLPGTDDDIGERYVPEGYRDLESLYYYIRDHAKNYDTIVIDSIDELSGLLIGELTAEHASAGKAAKRPLLMSLIPEQIEYLGNQQQTRNLLHLLKGLNKHVVVTAGYRRQHVDQSSGIKFPAGPDVAPSIQKVLGKWSSVFGNLQAGIVDKALGNTDEHRVLFTKPTPDRLAKSRFAEHTPYVIDPTFDRLWSPIAARFAAQS
jgi:hypothetical protein